MARIKDKEKAIKMRLQGETYSEIKKKLGVGKGTLSDWLHKYPLSPERMKEVRDSNPKRIENFRITMRKKREKKLLEAEKKIVKKLKKISKRDIFISGLFLYWAEGTKTKRAEISLANTDPAMINFYIKWLAMLDVKKNKLRIRLHLYSDMDIELETYFWSKKISIPKEQFRKPYIKKSKIKDVRFISGYGHGTCNVIYGNQQLADQVFMGIHYIRSLYGENTSLYDIK